MTESKYAQLLPAHRAVLFAEFSRAIEQGARFPGVFDSLAEQVPACFHAQLHELSAGISRNQDQPLLAHLENSPLFLPWEKRFLKIGLATLRIQEVAARICDCYVLLENSGRRIATFNAIGVFLLLLLFAGVGLTAAFSEQDTGSLAWITGGICVAGLFCVPWWSRFILGQWMQVDSSLWRLLTLFPVGRSCVTVRSLHQYLLNLGLCVQCGFDLGRTTRLSAQAEPVGWLRRRYQRIAEAVGRGEPLSRSVAASGLLAQADIREMPAPDEGRKELWNPGVIDAVRAAYQRQLCQAGWVFMSLTGMFLTMLASILLVPAALLLQA